jgi:CheY-like chemotaxis protein
MSRIVLLHWNAPEAEVRAEQLRRAGHSVRVPPVRAAAGLRELKEKLPDAFVVDLSRLPSQGAAVATWLRQQKPTREIPVVFAGGEPKKVLRIRKVLPDATYAEWSRIRSAIRTALGKRAMMPVVPGTMAPYAGTPLPKKLGIRAGYVVALLDAPAGFERLLGRLPDAVHFRRRAQGRVNLVLLFVKSLAVLKKRFPAAQRTLGDSGSLWIIWPKRSSGVISDLTQTVVRSYGLGMGFVDYKICAVDETWSGLCFTRQKKGRRG